MSSSLRYRLFSLFVLIVLGLAIAALPLDAQYFGRNKVQYERFDFKMMKTKHFDIYFYPEAEEVAQQAAHIAERWYSRLSRFLSHELKGRQPLILYASPTHFQQTTAIPGVLGEGTGGVTEVFKRRIVLPVGASLAETDHVIGHELIHAFQFDMTSQGNQRFSEAGPTILRLPLWFIEGQCEYLSIGPIDPHTAMWMRDASRRNEIPTIQKLDDPKYFPYRYGQAFWAYITGRWGDEVVARIMRSIGRVGDHEAALQRVLGTTLKQLSIDWQEALKNRYSPLLEQTQVIDNLSRTLFKGSETNPYNIAPALSPDGKEIIFLSTRDLFSIDMYLADAATGKIKQKITKTAVDPEFESIGFIASAGSWDPEGKQFIFGAVSKGKSILSIFDVQKGKIEKEIVFPDLGEIVNPTWSPDGRQIAFSALANGLTDIFIYDLETGESRKMTNDAFADLQPAWSTDGRTIAFVTDRFSTDFSIMNAGEYEIALMDPESGKIEKIEGFSNAKNINPQWSPDSASLYFLSDQSGKTDIFRLDFRSRKIFQVTNLYTGVSGITALSPAISVAQKSGRLAYSSYDDGNYTIFSKDSAEALAGNPELAQFGQAILSVLPPRERPEGALLGLLRNPLFGLPEEKEFQVSDYKSKLSLDYVSPPQMAVGVDRYGTYGAGGLTLFWSDMLGRQTVATMFGVTSRLKDSTALVGYINSTRRANWGAVVQRIPYVTGGYTAGTDIVFREPAYVEQEYLYWQINYDLSGFITYPFNQVRRFELSAGYRYIDFDQEIYTRAYSLYDSTILINQKEKLPSPPSIHFGYVSAALVYDSSFFGAASPILGQSYILEFSPIAGSLFYYSFFADYRRYLMPARPFTLAFRFLHYGRYGKDAEDDRLWPFFVGYETLVRGYDTGSFNMDEFTETNSFDFDRLLGSKIMVANVELRFPLFRVLGIGKGYYGVFPLEFLAFYDVGLAWTEDSKAWFLSGGDRKPVSSTGIGLRTNLMGFIVLGVDLVKPLSRPNKDWYFQFTFMPGF